MTYSVFHVDWDELLLVGCLLAFIAIALSKPALKQFSARLFSIARVVQIIALCVAAWILALEILRRVF